MAVKTLHYVPVDNVKAEWASKEALLQRWDGLTEASLNRWLREMRDHSQFKEYVIRPTHKIVMIHLAGFEKFMRWKGIQLFK